ncbi:MAG: DUF3120 domain-containing protein [Cyanobium sp.]|nr:DUF3120 domain-containing protein [Cyanobium sp.]
MPTAQTASRTQILSLDLSGLAGSADGARGPAAQGHGGAISESGAAVLVVLPVFLQAPWVRQAPFGAALFTAVLLTAGVLLARSAAPAWRRSGELLVGFSGSWLAGALFWGWAGQHPICHLPIEAFALPLALTGLGGRWRLACGFYLGSLLGTAATDAAIAACGLMPLWPEVLASDPQLAPALLHRAAELVLQPTSLLLVSGFAVSLSLLSRWFWQRGDVGRVASTALATTLLVDGLFILLALAAPHLSGLI